MAKTPRTPEDKLARQRERLAYLKRVDPKNAEIKELQAKIDAAGGTNDPNSNGSYNRGTVEDFLNSTFSNFQPLDLSGAPDILTAEDLEQTRQGTQDALYRENTQYLERDRLRDLEEAKQELANRGVVYDPTNPESAYGKRIGSINETYKTADQKALDNARIGADQRLATLAGVNKTAYDSYVDSAVKGFTSQLDAANTGNSLLNTLINDYHLTKDEALKRLEIRKTEEIEKAKIAAANRPKSSSSGAQTGGFDI